MRRTFRIAPLLVLLAGCPSPPESTASGPGGPAPGGSKPPPGTSAGTPAGGAPPGEAPARGDAPAVGDAPVDSPPGTPQPGEADAPPGPLAPVAPGDRLDKENAVIKASFEVSGTSSVTLHLTLAGGAKEDVGPFPGPCAAATSPGALHALTCRGGLRVRVKPEGGRIAVSKAPADSDAWEQVWQEPGPADGEPGDGKPGDGKPGDGR